MSSVEFLREFVNERLTVAAEEIFRVFKRTIVEYEEEIERQRKLLDSVWKPQGELQQIELPDVRICKVEDDEYEEEDEEEDDDDDDEEEERGFDDQKLCNQESNSSLDQEPPVIKEEPEQLCISQEGEQPLQNQQPFLLNSYQGSDHMLLFYNSNVAGNQDPIKCKHAGSGTVSGSKPEAMTQFEQDIGHSNAVYRPDLSDSDCNTQTEKKPFSCETCGKSFKYRSALQRHLIVHTGEKPYPCNTCGKGFRTSTNLKIHMRSHTGEKPYLCKFCGKDFKDRNYLKAHLRIHTDERPYSCKICGKDFRHNTHLRDHMRIHTGEKPFSCSTCGKAFARNFQLKQHIIIHSEDLPQF